MLYSDFKTESNECLFAFFFCGNGHCTVTKHCKNIFRIKLKNTGICITPVHNIDFKNNVIC